MKLSETQQRELALRLAQSVIKATSSGFDVTRQGYSHWAISHKQKDEIRMCALFLAEILGGDICELADAYVDAEIAKGKTFSEPLYDRAWDKAKQIIDGEKI